MKAPVQRFLSALCALSFLLAALFPTAALAAGADDLAVSNTLTREDAAQMQEADSAVAALTDSGDFAALSRAERFAAAQAQLQQLAEQGLVSVRSIYIDEANGMVSFSYSCGVQGGILVDDPEEENAAVTLSQMPSVDLQEMSNAPRGNLGSAMIYYAFDNTVNSSRYPYYSYMKGFWTAMGLNTRIDTMVTVADLRRMDRYDLCILSAHGAYYTYARGLFRKLRTEPVILLTEESSMTRDLFYGFDLLTHRVIKINGRYCVTAGFFKNAYRFGQLKDTLVYSETCEFLGVTLGLVACQHGTHLPVQCRADAAQPHGNVLVHGGLAAPERSRRCPHRGVVGGNVLAQLHGTLFRIGFHIPPPCVPALQWYNIRAAGADYVCGLDFLSHGAYTVGGHKNRGAIRLRSA